LYLKNLYHVAVCKNIYEYFNMQQKYCFELSWNFCYNFIETNL